MWIESLECKNFRNYEDLHIDFDPGKNFLYGNNAQGKTNILEALYMCSTSRSHRSGKDKELIHFEDEESHIRVKIHKKNGSHKIDIHLKKNKPKGIAVDGFPIKKASELMGILCTVLFSPEDLYLVKNGPAERRKFLDRELCQIDPVYMNHLMNYNRALEQKNTLLKEISFTGKGTDTLDIWDEQLVKYGSFLIQKRREFLREMTEVIRPLHFQLTGNKEKIDLSYEPNTTEEEYIANLQKSRQAELSRKNTEVGPHRDDFSISSNGINLRTYGSQGQQRSAALSLKMAEIMIMKKVLRETPVLLLDDVFSELDNDRQKYLLSEIQDIQLIMTGTGIDDLIRQNIHINKTFYVENAAVRQED